MEEFTILQSMLNILNNNNSKKKAIIETLPVLLDTYDIHGEFDVYNLIVANTQNLCFQVFDSQFECSVWKDSDVLLDNLKSLLTRFIDIIKKHSSADITRLFQHCVQLSNNVDFKNCSSERIKNIEFCVQKLYISCNGQLDDCKYLNQLRNTLINVLNEPYLNKTKFDVVLMFLNNIVSIHCIPTLWQSLKPMIKLHPDRMVSLLFNMQCLFFDPLCIGVILNDNDFWNLTCDSLTCENNIIRTYNNVILKLLCSQLENENVNCWANENKERCVKVWNDYVVVMETLENTQQHLILPVLSTAKKLTSNKLDDVCDNFQLPLKWITAMYCKMSKHSCKYVVLASIDIVTSMPMISLKNDEKLLRSFTDSLNNVFLYKMPNELNVEQPQLEMILSLWFNKLIMTNDGHDVFATFLSYISTIKWSIVALIFLSKSLVNISSISPLRFNIINHILNIKSAVEKMPNSFLKTVVLSFLFIFTNKFAVCAKGEFSCDVFDCITIYGKNTESWNYMINSIRKINDLGYLDEQLSQHINKKHNVYSTSVGLLVLSDINVDYSVCAKKLDEMCTNTVDISELLDFLECLLEVESHHGGYDNRISRILDKHIWSLTMLWINACLQQNLENSCDDDPVICKFLDKVLCSNRVVNTTKVMNTWLVKCNSILMDYSGNYFILAIYSWIGKYATRYSTESTLKNDWLSFTKYFIESGFFSLKKQGFYRSRKPGMHKIPQLDIINTFFQYSIVPEEQMLDVLDWLIGRTVERYDNCWSIYFSTAKTIFYGFPLQVYLKKIIQFIENCWEFLIGCRVSCFPNATKSFIEMAFHNKMLSEEKYAQFVTNKIVQNLLTEKYRDKFNVCFSLLLLEFFKGDQSNIINTLELYPMLSEFFAKCILFSIDRYSAMKIEWDTIEYIRTLNDFPLISDISTECLPDDKYLRFNTIKCLYKLNSNMLWKNVLKIIVKTESSLRDRKFFHNSKAYRIKQRAVQILLMVACDKQQKSLIFDEHIYKWSLSSLKEVCHIHSVAYQLIWLLVLIYNKSLSFSDFWNDFKNAQENHNYLCSFISIIYHLHGMKSDNEFEVKAKTHLLPLCFSNGYKIRLYAQVVICKLLSNKSKQFEQSLCTTIETVIAKNEETKKYENPFDDFFYQQLDVINSLSLKNVCVEVPRLLNIVYEERFPMKWLNDFSVTIINNDKYDLSFCSVSSYIEKTTVSVLSNEIIALGDAQNAQRKYVPSQPLDEYTTNSALIVVASLVDKTANLGGLARTCQVFGASTLVVDSLSCVEKREFTALSMSAEKHQYIIEVRTKNLKSYLKKKKNEGYQIVAAEQTVDSVKLHDTKFPFKCVLLLGNETSGIPHEFLSIMDTCIEIEQLGIVRSLNVHVAGSLFIWEYTKQHCLEVSSL